MQVKHVIRVPHEILPVLTPVLGKHPAHLGLAAAGDRHPIHQRMAGAISVNRRDLIYGDALVLVAGLFGHASGARVSDDDMQLDAP